MVNRWFLFLIILIPNFLFSVEKCESYRVIFSFKEVSYKKIYISSYDHSNYNLIDSFYIDSIKKHLTLKLKEPTVLKFSCEKINELFMINCGTNFINWDLSSKIFTFQNNNLNEIRILYDSLIANKTRKALFDLMQFNGDTSRKVMDSVKVIQQNITKDFGKRTRDFIYNYKNNFLSLFLLRHHYRQWDFDTVNFLFHSISRKIRKSPSAMTIDSFLKFTDKHIYVEKLYYIGNKTQITNFDYYIIDFWGSWCKPCIANIPILKNKFEYYIGKKVLLISIAYEVKKDTLDLTSIIAKYKMNWPQALVFKQPDTRTIVDKNYVSEFPTYFLLDKTYKIIFRGTGNDGFDELTKILDGKLSKE
jgi:thiol-disulfide isomerase/thioredoxin